MAAKKQQVRGQKRWLAANAALLIAVALTAVAVIESTHRCRQLYAQLQLLQAREWDMQENWSQLLLEESTWAAHYRVEKVATQDLSMHVPAVSDTRVVMSGG